MKYNVGDRVKIKDLKNDEIYGGFYVADGMLTHCGEVLEIVEVNRLNDSYMLKGCGHWWFNENMLEPINDSDDYISKGRDDSIFETEKTKEKTSLEKALELLNMTEEEVNREYDRRRYVPLAKEIARKFVDKCSNCIKCDDSCNICDVLFTIEYLREKGLLKDEF